MWPEIALAKSENKRELKLAGAEISERINADGVECHLFALETLNLLNISDTSLKTLPAEISNLKNLQTLLLYGNEIRTVPDTISALGKLKVLDISRNNLEHIPLGIADLNSLMTLNLSNNALTEFPSLRNSGKLTAIDLSGNKLTEFPDVCYENNCHLAEINVKNNAIAVIPHDIVLLASLKHLNLVNNKIEKIPKCLADISKLKDLEMDENPVADKRLLKLIQQCRTKQILDYVKQHGENRPKELTAAEDSAQNKSKKLKKNVKAVTRTAPLHTLVVQRYTEDSIKVLYDEHVKETRPYILCCIVKNVNVQDSMFRKFLQIQTKLHESVCGKREKSTIATHDLRKLEGTEKCIKYTAKEPHLLKIHPLGKSKAITALKLYNDLKAEAEVLRKEKKRNVFSGIHKYLYMLENKVLFSCIEDAAGNVISLPPLTNGDMTKISPESTEILVEVTSSSSLADCRTTIEELLKEMLLAGIGGPRDGDGAVRDAGIVIRNQLIVQQIKITDFDGNLKTVYPSKTDLNFDESASISVERE